MPCISIYALARAISSRVGSLIVTSLPLSAGGARSAGGRGGNGLQSDNLPFQRRHLIAQASNLGLQFLLPQRRPARQSPFPISSTPPRRPQVGELASSAGRFSGAARHATRAPECCNRQLVRYRYLPQESIIDAAEGETPAERLADFPATDREFHWEVGLARSGAGDVAFCPSTSMTVCAGAGSETHARLAASIETHDVFLERNAWNART